ncbi:zinc finger BED domain-containing protein RICESLEEPER 2-like [Neltuma alba]|uniref:zinc finger BED domain-containing protein RICESLEEPER 2-like n=1 Tax=Neltuma alba TaxID=207710 RepID=UPI0010A4431D|nr:zinc finger BED domain-containing protein RICESLEEPER 2-like [Prosopis alba]
MLSQAGIIGKVDHDRVREIVTMAIIEHDLPYSFFESKRMMELQKYLNPDFEHVSRETAMSYVCEFYISQKGKLKQIMSRSPSRICLTFDCWTTITSERYVCLTAHFVDENWKLNSKILAFCKMKPPYREFELAKNVHKCLIDWGIDKKLFSITLDNALMNGKMKDILKKRLSLQNSLICNGDFFHLGCCADILNLIVQEGLKVISIALQNIRESIKYVKTSEARIINFRQCVEHVGDIDTSMDLQLDVSTEWTSTYAMLESGIRYRQAFARLALNDSNYKCCPSNEEWKRAEEICTFLEPFKGITNLMSRSSNPTLNMYFMKMSKIELSLKENVMNVDPKIQDMAHRMKEKFNKYWGDYSVIFALGTILDPRLKFELIKYCYSLLDPIICRAKIETIKKKLYFVYSQYEDTEAPSSKVSISIPAVRNQPTVGACNEEIFAEAFGDKFDFKSRDTASAGKCELDKYLDEAILEPHSFEELDVLDYWKTNQIRFPHLSRMACDILSIPITTVANESVFGIGSSFLTKYRSCLLSNSDQALICIRNWLYGFKYNEDGIDDEDQDLNIISDDDEED